MPMEQSDTHDDRDLSKNSIRRRKLLSGVGTTMLASPLVGSVAAEGPNRRQWHFGSKANEIRQNDGQKAWKNYLQSQGCGIHSVKTGMKPSTGVGTQGFDNVDGTPSDCDICLDFTLYSDIYGNYTIDMFWTYDSEQLWATVDRTRLTASDSTLIQITGTSKLIVSVEPPIRVAMVSCLWRTIVS